MAGSKEDFLSGTDLIDRMHVKALQGASYHVMCQRFKSVNPDMLQYWMRVNGYIRNGFSVPHR